MLIRSTDQLYTGTVIPNLSNTFFFSISFMPMHTCTQKHTIYINRHLITHISSAQTFDLRQWGIVADIKGLPTDRIHSLKCRVHKKIYIYILFDSFLPFNSLKSKSAKPPKPSWWIFYIDAWSGDVREKSAEHRQKLCRIKQKTCVDPVALWFFVKHQTMFSTEQYYCSFP